MTYRKQEISFGILGMVVGGLLMVHTFDSSYELMAQDLTIGPMFFPRILFTIWLICATGITYQAMRKEETIVPFLWLRVIAAFVALLFFAATFNFLGFITIGVISFFMLSWIIGYRKPGRLAIYSCGYVVFIALVFRYALQSFLPASQLFGF